MARCPFAVWRPISAQYLPGIRKVAHNRMNVHITAALGSPFGYFNNPRKASSEFFTYASGVIEQFIDSDDQGEGDYDGNDATHAVENEGLGNAPLTPQQVASNARLFRWLRETHGVPNKIATNSKVGASSHGLSWHRLGIDGNFPALPSPLAGRIQLGGGMHYSTSRGKVCPGDHVVLQIPEIFALSQGAVPVSNPSGGGGSTTPTPTGTLPVPVPITTPRVQEDDMLPLIQLLYSHYNGRPGSASEWLSWVDTAAGMTSRQVHAMFRGALAEPGTVIAAYREILHRDPESTAVITQWQTGRSVGQVWDQLAVAYAAGAR